MPDDARHAFARLRATSDIRAARQVVIECGARALDVDPSAAPGLESIIMRLARMPATPDRRAFAVLVVDAMNIDGLLDGRARQQHAVCALLESALPDVLQRAGYPFDGDLDARRRALATLHRYLEPPEPTFPGWLSGLEPHPGG